MNFESIRYSYYFISSESRILRYLMPSFMSFKNEIKLVISVTVMYYLEMVAVQTTIRPRFVTFL